MEEKQMERYFVDVKQIGHWYERYEVEAKSEEAAKENWHNGDMTDAYEHCVFESKVKEVKEA